MDCWLDGYVRLKCYVVTRFGKAKAMMLQFLNKLNWSKIYGRKFNSHGMRNHRYNRDSHESFSTTISFSVQQTYLSLNLTVNAWLGCSGSHSKMRTEVIYNWSAILPTVNLQTSSSSELDTNCCVIAWTRVAAIGNLSTRLQKGFQYLWGRPPGTPNKFFNLSL